MGGLDPVGEELERHRAVVRGLCGRLVRSPARADELTQQTLLVALLRADPVDGEHLRPWLLGIARNLCRNERRKEANELRKRARLTVEQRPPPLDALDVLLREERDQWVRERTFEVLDELQRTVLQLRLQEQWSDAAINSAFELKGSGARAVLQTCRRRLSASLARRRGEYL